MRSRKNSLANNNLIEKILLQADFFLYIPQSGIYHIGARRYIVCQHIVPKAYHAPSADGATPLSRYTLTKSQNNAII